MDDSKALAGHLKDLADRSYNKGIYTFTNFLGDAQRSVLASLSGELSFAGIDTFGGREFADRVIVRFGKAADTGYEAEYPICCLKVSPVSLRFSETLTHRDYLGALMGLGIERELIGDIVVRENCAYIFCMDHISSFITENLRSVRRTDVSVQVTDTLPQDAFQQYNDMTVVVSSARLDALVSKICGLSRTQAQKLFSEGKVFVNGTECKSSSFAPKENDVISVRGYGKFIFDGPDGTTGKGRLRVRIRQLV